MTLTATATSTLVGRAGELAAIGRLLGEARDGLGSAAVVRGETGIGKSALLDHAAREAGDALVLRGSGIETEAQLPFAGLHLLLRPVLHRLDELPGEHARALRCALGTGPAHPGDRFATGLAVLELLGRLAAERPVVCLVDDAHWLDQASAETLLFAARRLGSERVLLLFAARDVHAPPFPAPGVAELRPAALDAPAADELLSTHAGDLPRHLRDQVAAEARGNPLALLELSAAWRDGKLPSLPYEVAPVPTHSRIQRAFADRIAALPETTRTLLLVAAADGTCDTGTVLHAATLLGASADDLRAAEQEQLLMFTDSCLGFRHPLIRTAAYQSAMLPQRLAAHRALAASLDATGDADRRAWQLAAASTGPDEDVARALEDSAEHAKARGGYGAVVAAYERAAALSPDRGERGRRLIAAARAAADAGRLDQACELAYEATTQLTDPVELARAAMIHATLAGDRDDPLEAFRVLEKAAESVADRAPDFAGKLLFWTVSSAWAAGDLASAGHAATRATELDLPGADRAQALATAATGEIPAAVRAARELASQSLPSKCPDQVVVLHGHARLVTLHLLLGDDVTAHELATCLVRDARARTAAGTLPPALALLATTQLHLGRPDEALATATEGRRLADDIGQLQSAAELAGVLARHAAISGDERRATTLASEAPAQHACAALGLLDLGLGRHEAALDRLGTLLAGRDRLATVELVPDLVDAAVHARRPERATEPLGRYVAWAELTGLPWARAVALRCRALLGEPELFTQALELHAQEPGRPFERARTELRYGEWLRRARSRGEARTQLRSALTAFERLGATPWAERARTELRATGESLGTAGRGHRPTQLTPQELRIARLAASGLSNRDIGARLFLSPRTVGYHLYKAYPKLGVASRGELAKLELGGDG